ncbi:MAG TPA: PAS domain S-box protein, partial [Chitinophagaceae bacterium]
MILTVSDTGVGIPPAELPKMFDRFHRVEQTTGRTFEGTGIGLSLVRELVKLHQGNITVDSEVGKGSRFTVVIPAGRLHLPDGQIAHSHRLEEMVLDSLVGEATQLADINDKLNTGEAVVPDHPYLLVVDDNADMRAYLKTILETDFPVALASNGKEALGIIEKRLPELIVSDIMMPEMDGIQLLNTVKANKASTNIPVILVSARAGEEAKVEGLATGADDYIVKPFSAKELQARVKAQIRIARKRQSANDQLRSFFEQAPAMLHIMKGPEHELEFFHPMGRQFVGNRDLTGMKVREALPELEGQGYFELLDEVYRSGKAISLQETRWVMNTTDGKATEHFFDFIYRPYYDEEGQIQGVLNLAIDVTDKVLARQSLENLNRQLSLAKERLEITFKNVPAGIYQFDNRGSLEFVNARGAELMGFRSADEMMAIASEQQIWKHFNDRFTAYNEAGNEMTEADSSTARALAERARIEKVTRFVDKVTGKATWILTSSTPVYDAEGALATILSTAIDITEQKASEAKVQYAATLTASISDAVIATDTAENDFRITSWNHGAELLYGWKPGEVIGKTATEILQTKLLSDRDKLERWETLNRYDYWQGEAVQKKKDGSDVSIQSTISLVRDQKGTVLGTVAVNRDISEQKQREAELIEAQQRYRNLSISLEELVRI